MSLQGYFIVYGTIAAIIAIIIGGAFLGGPMGRALIAFGLLGAVAAVIFVIWFFYQLNSST